MRRLLALLATATALALVAPAANAAQAPPFEPIVIQKIALLPSITEASTPVFTRDGRHLLFFSGLHLWIVGTDGSGLQCLSCGLANEPSLPATEQEGFATEFPDGRRIFFGAANSDGVLECSPSVVDCATRQILPVDLSGAGTGGGYVFPGGADPLGAIDVGGSSSPKLAPDGVHVAFSEVRSDAAELMVIATLQRTASGYIVTDPRVINPPGPTSVTDTNTQAWSDSAALYEFKTFADGGADATYAEVGGPATLNPDVWEVNLATGQRTRLTAAADWDEDDAPSPDGRSLVVESDRGMHRTDMLGGLMPVRGFIDAPQVAIYASYFVAGPVDRQCDLQPWLLPASGDDGARLMGEPLQPYTGGDVHAANNVSGWPQWSPDGTEIALNTESYATNRSAPYLLVAHLVARRPTGAMPVVSSEPGGWAPAPANYHGAIASEQPVVLRGLASGTATVVYGGVGVISGTDSVVYDNYSDNGRDVVNGTSTVTSPFILTGPIAIHTNLVMSGADTGYSHVDLTLSGSDTTPVTATGSAVTSYDGTTLSGPPHVPAPCPAALPRPPLMQLMARIGHRSGRTVVRVHLSASVSGAGVNEAARDTRPVVDGTIALGRASARTGPAGNAVLAVPAHPGPRVMLAATAGDTLTPARTTVGLSAADRRATCPPATGAVRGDALGPVRLGETAALVRARFAGVGRRHVPHQLVICLRPFPIRVGFPGRRVLGPLRPAQRARVSGRVVLALTANRRFAVGRVRPGMKLPTGLARAERFRIGANLWVVAAGRGPADGVLKVRGGRVLEVGILDAALSRGRRATRRLLASFTA